MLSRPASTVSVGVIFFLIGLLPMAYASEPDEVCGSDPLSLFCEPFDAGSAGSAGEVGPDENEEGGQVEVPVLDEPNESEPDEQESSGPGAGEDYCQRREILVPAPPPGDARWGSSDPAESDIVRCFFPGPGAGGETYVDYAVGPDALPPPIVVDPGVLAQRSIERLGLQPVEIGIAPESSSDSDSLGLVGLPVWMWVNQPDSTTFGPAALNVSAGSVSVSLTAQVERIEWSMGDGTVVMCEGPGTPYQPSYGGQDSPDCGHRYTTTSKATGGTFPVTATSYWVAEWSSNTGASGTIEVQQQATEQVRIGESQVIVTSR